MGCGLVINTMVFVPILSQWQKVLNFNMKQTSLQHHCNTATHTATHYNTHMKHTSHHVLFADAKLAKQIYETHYTINGERFVTCNMTHLCMTCLIHT